MKVNKSLLIIITVVLAFLFYWYGYRPSQIKKECSWVKKHQDEISAIPAMTEEELLKAGIINDCTVVLNEISKTNDSYYKSYLERREEIFPCEIENEKIIEEYKQPKQAISAKDWLEKASTEEYKFCLHSNGL